MRIMIKGGVWKNTEDEILKAAVMKYGKNQWARVSSLLVRKSAKQCKARWYEWLDPSIKKTEWTREEDEKLLHLAKLMPTQWRTIAPIVGRTPAQCLERYEKLLDAACSKDDNYDPADDPRRLRPGEIDPNPESKPARPDPVDMDEDEKEMLSEARARLANTRGKKAKRKAREKALEEARRLAQLQKTRELKAAGIELKGKYKKKKGIDYNAEVAFEKRAPHGFHDVSAEREVSKEMGKEFRPVTLEELEGKRRKDIEENLQKQDIKRQKMQDRNDAPSAVARNLAMNEVNPLQGRRGKMMLPAPQISEAELEAIAKMGADSEMDPEVMQGAGGDATKALLGNYSQTPLPSATPMRTPRTPAMGYDPIMQAAENLSKMNTLQTPLEGGENPELHPSDFSGVTPRAQVMATPNPIATPLRTPGGGAGPGATPSVKATPSQKARSLAGIAATPGSVMATPGRAMPGATPQHRDELGLNDPDATPATRSAQKAALAMNRNELLAGLSQLPAPQNEYQIMVPDLPEEAPDGDFMEEDAQDRQKRLEKEEAARRERELKKRSQVLQREMPRPLSIEGYIASVQSGDSAVSTNPVIATAQKMVEEEMLALMQHDNAKYPVHDGKEEKKKKKKDKKRKNEAAEPVLHIEDFEEVDLKAARSLISAEVEFLRSAMGHTSTTQDFDEIWLSTSSDFIHLPSAGAYVRASSATSSDRVASIQAGFDATRNEMAKEAARAAKLEKKVAILTGGLQAREKKLLDLLEEVYTSYCSATEEAACYKALKDAELHSAPLRIEKLNMLLKHAQEREGDLQARYKRLSDELAVRSKPAA